MEGEHESGTRCTTPSPPTEPHLNSLAFHSTLSPAIDPYGCALTDLIHRAEELRRLTERIENGPVLIGIASALVQSFVFNQDVKLQQRSRTVNATAPTTHGLSLPGHPFAAEAAGAAREAVLHRQHVVGQGRMQRNTSLGKNLNNLNKLNKLNQAAHAGEGNTGTKHHRRTHSGNSHSAPSSPRPGFKRNASSSGVVRTANHTTTSIRKNHSSSHLPRHGPSKNILKSSKSEIAPPKRSLANPGKARHNSPDSHPTVHFDLGNEQAPDDGPDDAWTEESASQSPTTTRSNTRSNSVVLDLPRTMNASESEINRAEPSQTKTDDSVSSGTSDMQARPQMERSHSNRQANGGSSQHHSRPPDADMITSRLLQRSTSHNPAPQMSAVAATVMSDSHDARILSHSQGSTLVDTPGRDLVSRFMDGGSSAGTSRDNNFLPSRNTPPAAGNEFDKGKRNKSMPNFAETTLSSPSRSLSRRSGTSTPTDLPPSRTQQKLMLQRASSNIEPQKMAPVILPRAGGPTILPSGMTYAAGGERRIDPRLQQQFNHITVEYRVIRRYRDPLADAVARLESAGRLPQKTKVSRTPLSRTPTANGSIHAHGSSSMGPSLNESTIEPTQGQQGSRRSRTSLESTRADRGHDDGETESRSFESETRSMRPEAEEICRRLWESTTEVAEANLYYNLQIRAMLFICTGHFGSAAAPREM
ncbi:hypothetical protein GQ43DRAFT_434658 [Delitschia confertaspora ATCC 74209]|uniref:Uncharacterized protein n=1 Tax=Delitschia confertaspora ATCC 74209 TaxID=1513339 RepID=A0A9P4JEL3_9PLEO|nr:hypothetical protein GQ43DRAFT_434658 [Delitschia confertaspora ATCC 74209]